MQKTIIKFVVVILFLLPTLGHSKELTEIVSIKQLLSGDYDRKRVAVVGTIANIIIGKGRLGSDYIQLDFIDTEIIEEKVVNYKITVVIMFDTFLKFNDRIWVFGTFRHKGREAGLLFEDFVAATDIIQEF